MRVSRPILLLGLVACVSSVAILSLKIRAHDTPVAQLTNWDPENRGAEFWIGVPEKTGMVITNGAIWIERRNLDGDWVPDGSFTYLDGFRNVLPSRDHFPSYARKWMKVPAETACVRFKIGYRRETMRHSAERLATQWGLTRYFPSMMKWIIGHLPNTGRWRQCEREIDLTPLSPEGKEQCLLPVRNLTRSLWQAQRKKQNKDGDVLISYDSGLPEEFSRTYSGWSASFSRTWTLSVRGNANQVRPLQMRSSMYFVDAKLDKKSSRLAVVFDDGHSLVYQRYSITNGSWLLSDSVILVQLDLPFTLFINHLELEDFNTLRASFIKEGQSLRLDGRQRGVEFPGDKVYLIRVTEDGEVMINNKERTAMRWDPFL